MAPEAVFVSLRLKSSWDTGVRPPKPADRGDESASLKDVPRSRLSAATRRRRSEAPLLTAAEENARLARRRIPVIL